MSEFALLKKKNFFLYYCFIFFLILFLNLSSIFPFSFAFTSHFSFTMFLSLSFFYGWVIFGIRFKNIYFFSIFYPAGVPVIVAVGMVFLEIVSYLSRVISLPVRLFANIMAGHVLIKILSHFSLLLFFSNLILFYFCFFIVFLVFILEIGVSIIQSYIFILLKILYFGEFFKH